MGVPGLTTYIAKRSERFLEPFDLHDTYLVIDGNSIACQLYNWYTKSNCAFGGDYDKYAHCVRKFFESLLKCNVTPLVIFDGGIENKKMQTVIKRAQDKIQTARSYTPLCQNTLKLFPALMRRVFKSVIKEMGIRHAQSLFEADNIIASVAKFLNCPVLSYDSDFYIYGVLYIPFNTMDINATRKWSTNYVKCCKIYRSASLINAFPGLDESMLPLAAILLGNDYIEQNVFKDFYQFIKLPKMGRLNHNVQQCRIEATLYWLSKHTLNTALCMIMKKVPHKNKKHILRLIKISIDVYTNTSTNILTLLDFSEEDIIQITSQNEKNNSNKQTVISHLKIIEEFAKVEIIDIDESELTFINNLPPWFIDEYQKSLLPSYCMSLLMHMSYIYPTQIEDYCQPSSAFISEKILSVMFTLLVSGLREKSDCAGYLTRGEKDRLTRYPLKYTDNIFPYNIPSLYDLRNTSLTVRREIFDITLGVEKHIDEFPLNWRLYVAVAKYWADNLTNARSHSHIYAVLFAMLHHIIDVKIGYYRSMQKFQSKYKDKLLALESKKKMTSKYLSYSEHMSINQAFNAVELDDCILLAPFFINNSEVDEQVYINPKKFKTSVVHLFALFQNCIEQSFALNALLGYPYKVTSISNMYNGTLLYNLYNNFYKRNNIENYINLILECSPTLHQLFNIILIKVKLMFQICPVK